MTDVDMAMLRTRIDSITQVDLRRLQIGCWTALIMIAIVRAWLVRYLSHGDGMSYMDLGRLWHQNYVKPDGTEIPDRAFWVLGSSIFAIAALNVITVALVGPIC
jgi:hypothetical protein